MTKRLFRNKLFYILLALTFVLTSFVLLPITQVNAAGNIIEVSEMDSNLYYKLQSIAGGTLRDDTIYSKNITELDLSFSALGAVSDKKKIASLDGLELLDLRKVTVLKVNNQNISEITESNLSGMPNLERLEISGNILTDINISQNAKLKVFIADNNYLDKVDLSVMDASGFADGDSIISLNNNKLESIDDIILPDTNSSSKLSVSVENNKITDIVLDGTTYKLNLGLQGLRSWDGNEKNIIDCTQNINFYGFLDSTITAKVFKLDGSNKVEVLSFVNGSTSKNTLSVGEYKIVFYKDGIEFNEETYVDYYSNMSFTVLPPRPTYYYLRDGERVNAIDKLTKRATLVIESVDDAKTYYSVNGGEWVEGNEINLTSGGSYPIEIKSVLGGYESLTTSIRINASLNLYLGEGVLILIIVGVGALFVISFFLIKKYLLDK